LNRSSDFLTDDDWLTILKWPVIFLGASPRDAPAMYSMITYAIHALGIWLPEGGMSQPALSLAEVARRNGVRFELGMEVSNIVVDDVDRHKVLSLCMSKVQDDGSKTESNNNSKCVLVDGVVAAADYEHVEQRLLPSHLRRYDSEFWRQATLSPSCLIYHLGFDQPAVRDPNHPTTALFESVLQHHTYFFDVDLNAYLRIVFDEQVKLTDESALGNMSFYVSAAFPPGKLNIAPITVKQLIQVVHKLINLRLWH
jgi:phytoene desaturase